jgi:uncharacterized RDD family membrane protein YckC
MKTVSAHETHRLHALDGSPLASFWSRAFAFAVDLLLFNIVVLGVSAAWTTLWPQPETAQKVLFVGLHTWWALAAVVVYFGLATYFGKGQTPGMRVLRIRVVSLVSKRFSLWHCVERALGYGASSLEAGFGFFQYFIHPNAQTVHDRIAETIVIDERASRQE